ncbi:hypothetical protein [Sabulibacter ruber]|uniref:hypothetical protein n=1 Tax=Sabulibacter ruber TaxID=2811901 RepID=UPI001A9749A5|nr:hypothetical protein [Sabulibacter ruber]
MTKSLLPLFSLALLGWACAPSSEKKVEKMQQEVLALHDSAMANMDTLYSSRKALTYLRDSVVTQDTVAKRNLTQGISNLAQADEEMMQWMRSYRNPDEKKPEEALTYLQQEKVKIEQVRKAISESLKAADSLHTHYSNNPK